MTETAYVTGASSGIGEAYAERLAADGWDLVVVARRRERLEDLARRLTAEHGGEVRVLVSDLGRDEDLERVCDDVAETGPDLLVNNAGVAHYRAFTDLEPARARELVDVNVLAPVLLSKAAVVGMVERGRGSIVNVASLLAFSGALDAPFLPQRAMYAATKSFLVTFSQVLAAEVSPSGVRVQVVCPGVTRSEFHSRQGLDVSAVPRMEPGLVVDASLADLEAGVTVSIPGLETLEAIDRVADANAAMLAASVSTELAGRYRTR